MSPIQCVPFLSLEHPRLKVGDHQGREDDHSKHCQPQANAEWSKGCQQHVSQSQGFLRSFFNHRSNQNRGFCPKGDESCCINAAWQQNDGGHTSIHKAHAGGPAAQIKLRALGSHPHHLLINSIRHFFHLRQRGNPKYISGRDPKQ